MTSADPQMALNPVAAMDELLAISETLVKERDLTTLMQSVLAAACRLGKAQAGCVYLLDHTKRYVYPLVKIWQGEIEQSPTQKLRLHAKELQEHPVIYATCNGQIVNLTDIYQFTGYQCDDWYHADQTRQSHTQSLLVLPLYDHQGRALGALELANYCVAGEVVAEGFPETIISLIRTLAAQAAVALENRRLLDQGEQPASKPTMQHSMIGSGHAMQQINRLLEKVAPTQATVLIRGETGTGKEVLAHQIHARSPRQHAAFIVQNCAAVPEGLLESELFGHCKGAFTGADADKKGLIEEADGGTLFLDEIGDMPLGLQAKLLRVLQDHEIRPVGGSRNKYVDVRVIAATHCDLEAKIKAGEFRQDLYFRLNVFPMYLPPLRERPEDIATLTEHFIDSASENFAKPPVQISSAALDALQHYYYPGNIRELKNLLERAVLLCEDGQGIQPEQIMLPTTNEPVQDELPTDVDLKSHLDQVEKTLIQRQLDRYQWNLARVAEALKIPRRTLTDKIKKYAFVKI